MVVVINNSATRSLVKNKDARSESIDSFSSTIDVHAEAPSPNKCPRPTTGNNADKYDDDLSSSAPRPFGLVSNGKDSDDEVPLHFDMIRPPNHYSLTPEEQLLCQALSSILVLNSPRRNPRVQTLLENFHCHLVDLGAHLLEGLRHAAPTRLPARVGDYNENLFYEMREMDQDICSTIRSGQDDYHGDLDPLVQQDIKSFEHSIRQSLQRTNITYRGSFMKTEQTMYQPAHVDYDYPILQNYGNRLFLAFFPLTGEGAFLQLWQENPAESRSSDKDKLNTTEEGTVVYIPYGKMLIVPSHTIHGGGFKRGNGGNLRFHLYIDVEEDKVNEGGANDIALLDHPMNKYTERYDRRRELCERFVDASGLESLLGVFFDV